MPQTSVLVVEDDDAIRTLLVEYLRQRADLEIESVRDGVEALHRLSGRHYDIVVLDLLMPHMSGIDLLDSLQILSLDHSLPEPPEILVITSEPQEIVSDSDITRRFPSYVRGVLRKPFDFGRLADSVQTLRAD